MIATPNEITALRAALAEAEARAATAEAARVGVYSPKRIDALWRRGSRQGYLPCSY